MRITLHVLLNKVIKFAYDMKLVIFKFVTTRAKFSHLHLNTLWPCFITTIIARNIKEKFTCKAKVSYRYCRYCQYFVLTLKKPVLINNCHLQDFSCEILPRSVQCTWNITVVDCTHKRWVTYVKGVTFGVCGCVELEGMEEKKKEEYGWSGNVHMPPNVTRSPEVIHQSFVRPTI